MDMECNCVNAIKRRIENARKDSQKMESLYVERLYAFRRAIMEGSSERIARMLFKAGAFQTCLIRNKRLDFGANNIVNTLESTLHSDKEKEKLYHFLIENKQKIIEQERDVVINDLLKNIVSSKKRADGLLKSNYEREIGSALSAIERVERLKTYLESWKTNIHFQHKIQYFKIVDIHD